MADQIDKIGKELASSMPDVQEHAIQAEENAQVEVEKEAADLLDRDGRLFDPGLHETLDGQPVTNKDGRLRMKRGRGSPRSVLGERRPAAGAPLSAPATTPSDAGRQIAEAIFAFGQLAGGEEWAPQVNAKYGIDERAQMQSAWAAYCESKDISDIPPGLAVTICMAGYAIPRFALPKTKSRLTKAREWIALKIFALRNRKNAARPDRRNDRERQNDTGETAMP